MRIHHWSTAFVWLLSIVVATSAAAASINDFVNYSLLDGGGNPQLRGLLHVPAGYAANPATPRPLILFLHGAGESGTDNRRQINGNIDNLLAAAKTRGAFLYAPQTNAGWSNAALLSHAMTMVEQAVTERQVDPSRIYVTGLSMGGGGVWNFVHQFPDRVAASVPICAVTPTFGFDPTNIVNEPIWAFHGRSDQVVTVNATRSVINSLLNEAGQPLPNYPLISDTFRQNTLFEFPPLDLRYTDMRGNHDIWSQVYNTPAMYDWMFSHGAVPEPGSWIFAIFGFIAGTSFWRGRSQAR